MAAETPLFNTLPSQTSRTRTIYKDLPFTAGIYILHPTSRHLSLLLRQQTLIQIATSGETRKIVGTHHHTF